MLPKKSVETKKMCAFRHVGIITSWHLFWETSLLVSGSKVLCGCEILSMGFRCSSVLRVRGDVLIIVMTKNSCSQRHVRTKMQCSCHRMIASSLSFVKTAFVLHYGSCSLSVWSAFPITPLKDTELHCRIGAGGFFFLLELSCLVVLSWAMIFHRHGVTVAACCFQTFTPRLNYCCFWWPLIWHTRL